jgi:phosphatidylserine decarboxylase
MMPVRPEVIPYIAVALAVGCVLCAVCKWAFRAGWRRSLWSGAVIAAVLSAYFLYFFRDPERTAPTDAGAVVSGADGTVAGVNTLSPDAMRRLAGFCGLAGDDLEAFAAGDVTRISIFLSLFDVHVNRAPIAGESRFLGYFPGKHFFTFHEKSSESNQHNSILISGGGTHCLINQIVGPVARRVVYWPDHDRGVPLEKGDRIGMMKFGSRLDMYLPAADIDVTVSVGDKVRAGETVVARLEGGGSE